MLINSAQKMPSIERRISIGFRNPAHQLSADILGSYLRRYLYLPSTGKSSLTTLCTDMAGVITVRILRYVSCVLFGNRQYTNAI